MAVRTLLDTYAPDWDKRPAPDSLQVSQDHWIATKPRGDLPAGPAWPPPRILPVEGDSIAGERITTEQVARVRDSLRGSGVADLPLLPGERPGPTFRTGGSLLVESGADPRQKHRGWKPRRRGTSAPHPSAVAGRLKEEK